MELGPIKSSPGHIDQGYVDLKFGQISMEIRGGYKITADKRLQITGEDSNHRLRELSLVIMNDHLPQSFTTGHDPSRGKNPVTDQPEVWTRIQSCGSN
jgi:hypothetical protein